MRIKVIYRKNLKMSEGKVAAQVAHAVKNLGGTPTDSDIIVLKVSDKKFGELVEANDCYVQVDKGLTEVEGGTQTAAAWIEGDGIPLKKIEDFPGVVILADEQGVVTKDRLDELVEIFQYNHVDGKFTDWLDLQTKQIRIGITGGIGAGKTTVSTILSIMDYPVFDSDHEAKALYDRPDVFGHLVTHFGDKIVMGDEIDLKELAKIVFNDEVERKWLTDYIYPLVEKSFFEWKVLEANPYCNVIIQEAAILFESGDYSKYDVIITVEADEEERIKRVMERDDCTEEDVRARMKLQWTDEARAELSDYVIKNNGEDLKFQVNEIMHKIENK